MTPPFSSDELGLGTPPDERLALKPVAQRLLDERPVPSAMFRGELRRSLLGAGRAVGRPARLRLQIALYGCGGLTLLAAGASSAAGLGPLSA